MINNKYSIFFIVLITSFLIFVSCNKEEKKDDDIIAKIGNDYNVTFDRLVQFHKDFIYEKRYRDVEISFKTALNDYVDVQLKCYDFFEKNLDQDNNLTNKLNRVIGEEITIKYFNLVHINKYINDEQVKRAYANMGKVVEYQEIILVKNTSSSNSDIEKLKNKAEEIKEKVESNEDFGELVKEYSSTYSPSNPNGLKPPVSWEQSLNDPIGNIIYNLDVNSVKILNDVISYHIVKVIKVNKVSVEPFEQIKEKIKNKLIDTYSEVAESEFEKEKETIINEDEIEWNNKGLAQIIKWSKSPAFYLNDYKKIIPNEIKDGNNFIIFSSPSDTLDLKRFQFLIDNVLITKSNEDITEEVVKYYLLQAYRTDGIIQKAKKIGLVRDIFNAETDNNILKHKIVKLYNDSQIVSKFENPTEADLQNFYLEQKDSLYYQLKRSKIYVMLFSSKEEAESVKQKIDAGTEFEKVTGRYFIKSYIITKNDNYQSYLSQEEPYLAEIAFGLEKGEITKPLVVNEPNKGTQYAIIKCEDRLPEKQLAREDVSSRIEKDYKKINFKNLESEILNGLKQKYKVEKYHDVLYKKLRLVK